MIDPPPRATIRLATLWATKKTATQIGVEDAVVILRRDLEKPAGDRHPGVIDEDVEGGEGGLDLGHRRRDGGAIGDVQRHGKGAAAPPLDIGSQSGEFIGLPRGQGDRRAMGRQNLGEAPSEPLRGTGHQSGFTR